MKQTLLRLGMKNSLSFAPGPWRGLSLLFIAAASHNNVSNNHKKNCKTLIT